MAIQRVRPFKMETTTEGGVDTDLDYIEVNPNQDYVDAAGSTFQDGTSKDATVYLDRVNGCHRQTDQIFPSSTFLSMLATLDDSGPACTAYLQLVGTAPFFTGENWYSDAAMTKLIVSRQYTQSGGTATPITPTPIVTKFYGADGVTVLATFTDTITYSGPFVVSKTRVRS